MKDLFGIMIAVAVQNAFYLEIHQNEFFIFKKIIFNISTSKRSENIIFFFILSKINK